MQTTHQGIVFGGDSKCIVCWYYCGEDAKNQRCSGCQGYNRYSCEKCLLFNIKVPIGDNRQKICEYCGGDFPRLHAGCKYSLSSDYDLTVDNLNANYIVCDECYVAEKYETTKMKCDFCKKYRNKVCKISGKELSSKQKCIKCGLVACFLIDGVCCSCSKK
jgi:hypothetical protein